MALFSGRSLPSNFVSAGQLRGIRIVTARPHGDLVEVETYCGEKYFLERTDFEAAERNRYWSDRSEEEFRRRMIGDYGTFAAASGCGSTGGYGGCSGTPSVRSTTQQPAPPSPVKTGTTEIKPKEKNSLKRVYYHNRLRKKS